MQSTDIAQGLLTWMKAESFSTRYERDGMGQHSAMQSHWLEIGPTKSSALK